MFPYIPKKLCNRLRQIKKSFPNLIPHKIQYINDYICTCLALFFILVFIRLPEYHILQFHTFFLFLECYIYTKMQIVSKTYIQDMHPIQDLAPDIL